MAHVFVQAIVTKYFAPTNHKGARIKAMSSAGSVTIGYEHGLTPDGNHTLAAHALARKFNWAGRYIGGGMPGGNGNCYVCADNGYSRFSETDDVQAHEFTISRDPVTGESVHFKPKT